MPYTLSGISAADVSGSSLSGNAVVNSSGVATISVTLLNDALTEEAETLTVTAGGATASTLVNDTSKGVATYSLLAASASVNEGSTATFTLSTTNLAAGTEVVYTLSGVNASDITGGALSGTASVNLNGTATISIPITADLATEGAETLTVTAQGKSASMTINDTSKSPIVVATQRYSSEVQKLYLAYFNRPADPGGMAYWKGLLANDVSMTLLQNSFSSSAEYQAIYIGQQNTVLITKLYQNLFGRVVDANDGGVQWWAGEMFAGRHTITTIAGALSSGTTPGSADNIAIINKIEAAAAFTNALDTAAETENYVGAAAFTIASNWLAPIRDANMLATALASRDATIAAATMDTTTPIVSSFSPADGATGVAVGSNIVLTFSEAVVKGTGNIEIRTGSASGNLVESFNAASSSRLTFSGSTLSIDPTNDFASNTNYFVTFAAGTVKDAAGNSYAGISTYDFRTVFGDPLTTSVNYYESRADGGYGWYAKYDLSFNGSEFIVTTRIDLTGDPTPSSYLYVWETGIETLWNSFYFTNQSEKKFPVVFDVQFVNNGSNEHYDVQVVATTGRGNMTTWYLYQDWGRSYDDEFAAHEYGHMIGMFDEYYGGATYAGFTKTGTLMSDLSRNLSVNYLSGVEYRAELLIGGELTTTKSPSMQDYFTYAADLQSEFGGVQLIGLDLNNQT